MGARVLMLREGNYEYGKGKNWSEPNAVVLELHGLL